MALRLRNFVFYLTASCLSALTLFAQTISPDTRIAPVAILPECPVVDSSVASPGNVTKAVRIDYYPSSSGASMKNPTQLTLRLAFNGADWRNNNRTLPFQKQGDGSWRVIVPINTSWSYAVWYVRDDTNGQRDDNHGQYWDFSLCGVDGKKRPDAVRYQARSYLGSILADDIRRTVDYDRAISIIEASRPDVGYRLLDEEWYYKYRRSKAESSDVALEAEFTIGLAAHSSDPNYVNETAGFLVRFEKSFPAWLLEYGVHLTEQVVPNSSIRRDLARERAEGIENLRQRAIALGEWLARYPDDQFYDLEIRKERLNAFGDLGDVTSAQECFQDLVKRVPDEADLYATMASIYIRQRVQLDRALGLLEESRKYIGNQRYVPFYITLHSGDPLGNTAIIDWWRGRALAQQSRWNDAEESLAKAVSIMDKAEPYSVLAHAQEQQQKWKSAKANYLQAAIRESKQQQQDVDHFVAMSLKTGTPTRDAALKELAGARKENFDSENYKPQLLDMPLPVFTLKVENGTPITASQFRGKISVLNLWATWCGPCVAELSGFERFRQLHPDVVVLIAAEDSSVEAVRKVLEAQGLPSKTIVMADDENAAKFGSNGVPQTYIIDGEGRIRIVHYGGLSDVVSYLEADLATLGAPVVTH